jgi:hypothetical protein
MFRIADQPDKTLPAAEESGYHLTGMPSLRVQIVRFVDAHQPGVIECQFRAADGQMHSIIDKLPIFTDAVLSSDSQYPQPGAVRCQVLGQVSADGAVRITLVEPDHVQATDGGTQFVVTEAELTV